MERLYNVTYGQICELVGKRYRVLMEEEAKDGRVSDEGVKSRYKWASKENVESNELLRQYLSWRNGGADLDDVFSDGKRQPVSLEDFEDWCEHNHCVSDEVWSRKTLDNLSDRFPDMPRDYDYAYGDDSDSDSVVNDDTLNAMAANSLGNMPKGEGESDEDYTKRREDYERILKGDLGGVDDEMAGKEVLLYSYGNEFGDGFNDYRNEYLDVTDKFFKGQAANKKKLYANNFDKAHVGKSAENIANLINRISRVVGTRRFLFTNAKVGNEIDVYNIVDSEGFKKFVERKMDNPKADVRYSDIKRVCLQCQNRLAGKEGDGYDYNTKGVEFNWREVLGQLKRDRDVNEITGFINAVKYALYRDYLKGVEYNEGVGKDFLRYVVNGYEGSFHLSRSGDFKDIALRIVREEVGGQRQKKYGENKLDVYLLDGRVLHIVGNDNDIYFAFTDDQDTVFVQNICDYLADKNISDSRYLWWCVTHSFKKDRGLAGDADVLWYMNIKSYQLGVDNKGFNNDDDVQ